MLKIGIIKEGKTPPDERVPLIPEQCKFIKENFDGIEIKVQSSNVRRIKDKEYIDAGIDVVKDISDSEVLFGVKEVPIDDLIAGKTYFYFSHTIKKQPYNRKLLQAMLAKNITMIDWETLKDKNGNRIIGFGKYAGIVGCYNTLLAYGKFSASYDLKRAYLCNDKKEVEKELTKVQLPGNFKIILTGGGRVATGAMEILDYLKIKKVSAEDILNNSYDEPVYAQLHVTDYYKRIDGQPFTNQEFYNNPSGYVSDFMKYAQVCDMYLACHFWDEKAPFIFTKEDVANPKFKIKFVGDISCDIDGPIACTIRPSTVKEPFYGYHKKEFIETEPKIADDTIIVMAVDNLPCELPRDASKDFGNEIINKVLPQFFNGDKDKILEKATICKNGQLTPYYSFLQDYVDEVTV
ncbi:MAG: NAD(P)-dependent oxidoreductase [Vicingaceae bacterium]